MKNMEQIKHNLETAIEKKQCLPYKQKDCVCCERWITVIRANLALLDHVEPPLNQVKELAGLLEKQLEYSRDGLTIDEWMAKRIEIALSWLQSVSLSEQVESEQTKIRHPISSNGTIDHKSSYCYTCGTPVKNQKYCHGCGRKLIWNQPHIQSRERISQESDHEKPPSIGEFTKKFREHLILFSSRYCPSQTEKMGNEACDYLDAQQQEWDCVGYAKDIIQLREEKQAQTQKIENLQNCMKALWSENKAQAERIEKLEDVLQQIQTWAKPYSLDVFPNEVLEAAGMTLDAINANAMRHVLLGVQDIVQKALAPGAKPSQGENLEAEEEKGE